MGSGGKRSNSGPKKPMSPYGEKTSVIRVPVSLKDNVVSYLEAHKVAFTDKATGKHDSLLRLPMLDSDGLFERLQAGQKELQGQSPSPAIKSLRASQNAPELKRPIYSGRVSAGQSRFPSPAQDYEQEELDLNKLLVTNPPATFFYRVGNSYDSMIDVGILPASLLVVDRSITPKSSHIVLAEVEREHIVKRLYKWRNTVELRSENKEKNYPAITFADGQELIILGVVKSNVNEF